MHLEILLSRAANQYECVAPIEKPREIILLFLTSFLLVKKSIPEINSEIIFPYKVFPYQFSDLVKLDSFGVCLSPKHGISKHKTAYPIEHNKLA